MNNPELSDNGSANSQADQWDILPKDNFYQSQENSSEAATSEPSDEEIRQILIAKRMEQLQNHPEARDKASSVARKLIALALAATTLVGGIVASQAGRRDIMESDQAKWQITEMKNAKEVIFYGSNVRSNPETTNSADPTNIYASAEEEVRLDVDEDSKILYYRGDNDPNGSWYGIPVDLLEQESFISKSEARRMKKDRDQYVWVNHNYAKVVTSSPDLEG